MKVNESTVTVMRNCRIPDPPYYALYKRSLCGHYYLYLRRNITLEEVCDIAKDIPSKWRAYPRLTDKPMPMPKYHLHAQKVGNDDKVLKAVYYHSVNWRYICTVLDKTIDEGYNNVFIQDIYGKIILTRSPDGSVTISNKVTLPKRRPEPKYKVTVTTPDGLNKHYYRYAWKYAKRKFNEAVKVYDKVDVTDLATGEVYMSRNGVDWYFAVSITTLQ